MKDAKEILDDLDPLIHAICDHEWEEQALKRTVIEEYKKFTCVIGETPADEK